MSPSELREALSGLGKAAIKFELSEMHDAAEVRHSCCRLAQVQSPLGFWMPLWAGLAQCAGCNNNIRYPQQSYFSYWQRSQHICTTMLTVQM